MASDSSAHDLNAGFEQFVNSLPQDAFTSSDGLLAQPAVAGPDGFGPYALSQAVKSVRPIRFLTDSANDARCSADTSLYATTQSASDPFIGLEEPDYGKFENWIEGFIRPEYPCDYCRIRKLDCHMKAGNSSCNTCITLFRECSLSDSQTLEALNYADGESNFFDTLHSVAEDSVRERGTVTGIKPLFSKPKHGSGKRSSSPSPVRNDDAPGSSKRNGIRFPRHAVKILRDWLDSHADHPYPSEEEKTELERRTELKPTQIANWLANARRRRKVTTGSIPRGCQSPSLRAATPAIAIPASDKPWDELNPFERWQHSPPENEPASVTDIVQAVANAAIPDENSSISGSSYRTRHKRSSAGSNISGLKENSIVSGETDHSSWSAASSSQQTRGSMSSRGSSFVSFSSSLAGKRDRRRRRRQPLAPTKPATDAKKRIFQCTFCTDTFKSKYDWTRHEKSLHLSLEKWVCAPMGAIVQDRDTGVSRCAYCGIENPNDDHVESHNHRQCAEKGLEARTFFRKDHLRQHLRLMHCCELLPIMEPWKSIASHVNSRCGFCAKRFTVWQERVDHLTAHFKAGARMAEWKGCRGLDPAVAAQVTNAMPPYLIGLEQLSPVPFSATDRASWVRDNDTLERDDTPDQAPRPSAGGSGFKTTCWERLTIKLGMFASEAALRGEVLSDEMLQREARMILYESDDAWNHTAADNPEWLDLFKKAHGLDFIPSVIGGEGHKIPEDLETYGDLGLRIPFAVQLKAYNEAHTASKNAAKANALGDVSHPLELERKSNLQSLCAHLQEAGMLHDFGRDCSHIECAANTLDVGMVMGTGFSNLKRWCAYELPPEQALELATQTSSSGNSSPVSSGQSRGESQRRLNLSQGLQSLSSPLDLEQESQPYEASNKKAYLQRHRYELPQQQAQRFATITPAWVDSGSMPPVQLTEVHDNAFGINTSTGAMMEFLGGGLGYGLPFSQDAETSPIRLSDTAMQALNPSPEGTDWLTQEGDVQHERAVMQTFDQMLSKTSRTSQPPIPAPVTSAPFDLSSLICTQSDSPVGSSVVGTHVDFAMDDISFDDLNFDGVFDLDMGEHTSN
ncbi:hypothetical protein K431DRAFT_259421 [Polychaeton citri CBS 116435]|uniref:Homeobox domain-containing protein n=1 Tax=Polychaeton citri CBS 116435 TaxID=1314669 RepID=A0A9P4QIZ8_9PEZI|nr:hypothetical protein K431DRAFT_259421 [Polychaeton citri CBS 116435]